MRKNLIFRLALVGTIAFSLHSCRTEDEVISAEEPTQFRAPITMFQKFDEKVQSDAKFRNENRQQDVQQPAERNSTPYISTVNIPISAVSYKVPFKETIAAFLADTENSAFSQEFYSKFGSPFYAVSTYTYGNNSKAIAFPLLKGDQVTAFIHGIVTPARDYVQFTVVQNTEPATLQVLARLQYAVDNLYPSGPVMSRGIGTNEEHIRVNEIEEITIVKINHMDQTGGFILHHPGSDWWKDASWADPKNGPMGGGQSMSGDGSRHKFPDYMSPDDDPCKKVKNKISDAKFFAKFQELNKPEMFAMDHEKGFYERLSPVGSNLPSGFPVIDGAPCSKGLDFPENENGVAGLLHIHNDYDCEENSAIKIFSPKDVRTFLNKLMKQSRIYTGSYTNAYSTVITSQGSYMLRYTNESWPGSTWDKIDTWNAWYNREYENLTESQLSDQGVIEKVFVQFLKEAVGIDGLQVYKIDGDTTKKLEYDGKDKPVKKIPCS